MKKICVTRTAVFSCAETCCHSLCTVVQASWPWAVFLNPNPCGVFKCNSWAQTQETWKCWASQQLVLNAILLYQGLKSDLTDSAFIWSIQFSIISYRIQLCCLQCLFLACHMSAVQDESSHTNIQLQILVVVRALSVISSVILCVSLRSALSSKSWRLRCSPSGRPRETDDQRERERWWRTIRRPQVQNTAWVHRNTASCLKYTVSVHRNTVSVPSLMKLNCLSAAANQKAGKGGRKSVFDKELTNTSSKALKHYRAGWDTCLYVCSPVCLFTYL